MSRIALLPSRRKVAFRFCLPLCSFILLIGAPARETRGAQTVAKDAPTGGEEKPIDVELVRLETKDGLQMEADYYASKLGKEAVPVVMLHGWKGSRADLSGLARALQAGKDGDGRGHAVIVPDLRGHGKSTQIRMGSDARSIDQSLMKKADFDAMVTQDMEAVKRFLIEKNNVPELNIEKLCVVGADMGAAVAMSWAVRDWAAPRLLTGKQGQDVKALVLISPPINFRGLSITPALASPTLQTDLSVLIVVGGDKTPDSAKAIDDAQRIYKKLGATRPKPPTDPEEVRKNQDLFFDNLKTSLQGTKILKEVGLRGQLSNDISGFVEIRLVLKTFPWAIRKSALGD